MLTTFKCMEKMSSKSRRKLRESPAKTRYGVVIDVDFPRCKICSKSFASNKSRTRHLHNFHGLLEEDEDVWCDWRDLLETDQGSFEVMSYDVDFSTKSEKIVLNNIQHRTRTRCGAAAP